MPRFGTAGKASAAVLALVLSVRCAASTPDADDGEKLGPLALGVIFMVAGVSGLAGLEWGKRNLVGRNPAANQEKTQPTPQQTPQVAIKQTAKAPPPPAPPSQPVRRRVEATAPPTAAPSPPVSSAADESTPAPAAEVVVEAAAVCRHWPMETWKDTSAAAAQIYQRFFSPAEVPLADQHGLEGADLPAFQAVHGAACGSDTDCGPAEGFKGSKATLTLRCRPGDWRNASGQAYVARTCQAPGRRFQWCDQRDTADCAEGFVCALDDGQGNSLLHRYEAPSAYSSAADQGSVGKGEKVTVEAGVCIANCESCMVRELSCCTALTACGNDSACKTCLTECIVADDPAQCWKDEKCMPAQPGQAAPNAAFQAVAQCISGVCQSACGVN